MYNEKLKKRKKERMFIMTKKEFLSEFEARIEEISVYQSSNLGNIDGIKEKLIPVIQKDFLESVPKLVKRGMAIKIQSKCFKLDGEIGGVYYILISNERHKIGTWCDGLRILQQELCEELSSLVERNVMSSTEDNMLKFYFFL